MKKIPLSSHYFFLIALFSLAFKKNVFMENKNSMSAGTLRGLFQSLYSGQSSIPGGTYLFLVKNNKELNAQRFSKI